MMTYVGIALLALAFASQAAVAPGAPPAGTLKGRSGDAFFLGTWKITKAIKAPWWDNDPAHNSDVEEMKSLVGKTVIFQPKGIVGPRQVACRNPNYQVKDYPADMLFQGAFGEMHLRDKSVDPAKLAASVGFKGRSWRTLETGCATELDFHFIDPNTSAFGLNNYIYILQRQ